MAIYRMSDIVSPVVFCGYNAQKTLKKVITIKSSGICFAFFTGDIVSPTRVTWCHRFYVRPIVQNSRKANLFSALPVIRPGVFISSP